MLGGLFFCEQMGEIACWYGIINQWNYGHYRESSIIGSGGEAVVA